jgi:hypothetical protein
VDQGARQPSRETRMTIDEDDEGREGRGEPRRRDAEGRSTSGEEHRCHDSGDGRAGQQDRRRESEEGGLDLAGEEAGEAGGGRSAWRQSARARRPHGRKSGWWVVPSWLSRG